VEKPRDDQHAPFLPSVYIWVGVALLAVAAWIPVLSDGFSDPAIAAPFFGFLAGLGLASLLTGGVAQGILLARSEVRRPWAPKE
jgi:biotin transporter BioY